MSEPESPDETPVESEDVETGRTYPSTIGGGFYLLVLAVSAIAIGVVGAGEWRLGIRWFGGALTFAAAVRAVLPTKDAGMLAVRRRWFDCLLLAGFGLALIVLASSIPEQPS